MTTSIQVSFNGRNWSDILYHDQNSQPEHHRINAK